MSLIVARHRTGHQGGITEAGQRDDAVRTEIRTFILPDEDNSDRMQEISSFLRTVEVQRIDTAYAGGAWRILVLYHDLRSQEESAQIRSAIAQALQNWRVKAAQKSGDDPRTLLPDSLVAEIAAKAPTTLIELANLLPGKDAPSARHGAAIVDVVKETMSLLAD
jgi:ribonuclease D